MRRLSERRLKEIAISSQIEEMFIPYLLLDLIARKDIITSVRETGKQYSKQTAFFQGYKLALVVVLFLYLDSVVRSPEMIGLPSDPVFEDYWKYTKKPGKSQLRSSLRSKHSISAAVSRVQSLFRVILKANSWENLIEETGYLADFSVSLRRVFVKSFRCREMISGRWKTVDAENALRSRAYDILWSWPTTIGFVQHAYADIYRESSSDSNEEFDSDWAHTYEEPQSRLDHIHGLADFERGAFPRDWMPGYMSTLYHCLSALVPRTVANKLTRFEGLISKSGDLREFHQLVSKMMDTLREIPGYINPQSKWLFRREGTILSSDLRALLFPIPHGQSTQKEQVKSMLGNMVKIVESQSPAAHVNFNCLLDGAILRARRNREKAPVAIIKHPTHSSGHDFSFAIFMPARSSGLIPMNASSWWVFFDICNDYSGTASSIYSNIMATLDAKDKYVERQILTIDRESFLDICEEPGYTYIRKEHDFLRRLNDELRATYPELLIIAYLAARKAHPIKSHVRPRFLNKKELDVIGVLWKDDGPHEICIVESKGKSSTYDDLQKELLDFEEKILKIRDNLPKFTQALGVSINAGTEINAIFVSMADVELGSVIVPRGVILWDFVKLQQELKKVGIPREYISLLKRTILIKTLSLGTPLLNLITQQNNND